MGTKAPPSVRDELVQLEAEKEGLLNKLTELRERQTPWQHITSVAKKFVENWSGVGELIQQATPDERRTILEQFVDVIQLVPSGKADGTGTYLLRVFPDAAGDAGHDNRRVFSVNREPVGSRSG